MSARVKGSTKVSGVAPSPKLGAAASPSTTAAASASAARPASAHSAPAPSSAAASNAATLQVFWDLASEDAAVRTAACQVLITSLAAEQRTYTSSGGPAKAAAAAASKAADAMEDDDDGIDEADADAPITRTALSHSLAPSLAYALKRLTRGLASSRAGARQGFALALTEILVSFPVVPTEEVLNIVADQIKLSTKANKQETRDYHLGRVFFALVLIRSNRILSLSDEALCQFLKEILEYAKAHLPIREVSYETVTQLVRRLPWTQWQASPRLRRYILGEVANQTLENLSIEQVGLALALKEYYKENGADLPSSSNPPTDLAEGETPQLVSSSVRKCFLSKYLPQLHTALFSSMQHYATSEKLHSTWRSLLLHLWRSGAPLESFADFWRVEVDENLFGGSTSVAESQNATNVKSTSYQKKFIGFQLVNVVLQLLPTQFSPEASSTAHANSVLRTSSQGQLLSIVFRSRNFLRTFTNNLSSKKNTLYGMALLVKKTLLSFARAHAQEILPIVSALEDSATGGHMRFDARTNSNTVTKLLEGLDVRGVQDYVQKLIDMFVRAVPVQPTARDLAEAHAAAATAAAKEAEGAKGKKKGAKGKDAATPTPAATAVDAVDSAELAQAALDSTRSFCVEQLFTLARNKNLPQGSGSSASQGAEGGWLHRVVQFFFYFGFMDTSSSSSSATPAKSAPFPEALASPLSEKVQSLLSEKLFHLLNELLPHAPVSKRVGSGHSEKAVAAAAAKGKKGSKAVGPAADEDEDEEMKDAADESAESSDAPSLAEFNALFSASSPALPWALRVQRDWSAWTGGKKPVASLASPLSKEDAAARTAALDFIEQLRSRHEALLKATTEAGTTTEAQKAELAQLRSLQLLILHLSLLLLKEDERSFAAPLLSELQEGVEAHFAPKKPAAKKGSKKAEQEAEEASPFINVLVDILLSLLVRPSTLFRDIARSVFGAFASAVNGEALDDLLEVLRRKEKAPGMEGDDDEDENSEDFEDQSDEDEEMEDAKEEKKEEKKKQSAPKKGGKKLSALDAEAAANAEKFKALAAGSDDDSDDEELIDLASLDKAFASKKGGGLDDLADDEEGENDLSVAASYDAHLGNIVRLRQERKSIHKEFAQQSLHFKLRIADLLEVYAKNQAANPLVLDMFLPLLLAIDASRGNADSKQLEQRLVTLFKKMCGSKEHPPITPEVESQIRELQTLLMRRARKSVHRETLHLTNVAILFLTKITVPHDVKEQVAATQAAMAPTPAAAPAKATRKSKAPAAAAPAESSVAFVLRLYRTELVQYLTVKHSILNTKFFESFVQRFPGMAWSFVGPLAQLAQAKLPGNEENKEPRAANAFLRNDCFILLGTIFNNRHLLKDHDLTSSFHSFLPSIQESIRSTLLAATLPKSATEAAEEAKEALKQEDADSEDEDAAEAAEEGKDAEKKKDGADEKMKKKDREKLKARAKKKRRQQKAKEAARLAALANGGAAQSEEALQKAQEAALRSTVNRLKTMLKFANQAALAFAPAADASSPSPVCSLEVRQALSALPPPLATPLKGALHNFLLSARVDKATLSLQIDDDALAKAKAAKQAKAAKKAQQQQAAKKPAASAAAAAAAPGKKKAANGKSPAATAASPKPAKEAGKKRPAGEASSGSADKKQKVAAPTAAKSAPKKQKQ